MDWRHNQWVGVGAAVLLVVGVVGVFMYVNSSGTRVTDEASGAGLVFECESTGQTFFISNSDLDDEDTYTTYLAHAGEAVLCKICGKVDAWQVYYCPVDQKYFRYKKGQADLQSVTCPNGHEIEGADR